MVAAAQLLAPTNSMKHGSFCVATIEKNRIPFWVCPTYNTSLGTSEQWSARSLIGDVPDDFPGCRIKDMRTIGIYPQLDV
jgi:hypothetical protein